ncbi:MAG: hypothetical protein NVS9B14_01770 [Candidatus Acidiferrum sp.]
MDGAIHWNGYGRAGLCTEYILVSYPHYKMIHRSLGSVQVAVHHQRIYKS